LGESDGENKIIASTKGLSPDAIRIWRKLTAAFHFDNEPSHQLLLQTALLAFDRMHQARELIAAQGLLVPNRYKQNIPNPLLQIEDKSRRAKLAALAQLGLEPAKLGEI